MNKLTKSILLTVFIIFSAIYIYGKDEFKLHGKFDRGKDGDYIMLFTFQENKILTVDTSFIKNNSFLFTGREYLDNLSLITYGNYPDTVWYTEVILEKGDIYVDMGIESKINGTPLNELYQSYQKNRRLFFKKGTDLYLLYNQDQTNDSIKSLLQDNLNSWRQYFTTFTKQNISSLLGRTAFIDNIALFDKEDFLVVYDMLPDSVKRNYKVVNAIEHRNQQDKFIAEREGSINGKITDFNLIDIEGNNKLISEIAKPYRYLYIDFWASWCAPCIAEMPHLKKIYEKYKDNGLGILSISIDTDIAAWKHSMKKNSIPWNNLCDLKGGEDLMKAYNFKGVPYGLLIDNSGKIIEVNLRAGQLDNTLKRLIDL